MTEEKLLQRFKDFENALMRLKEALAIEVTNEIIIDGVIQRFEFTFELAWKIMKDYLAYEGIEVNSPRSAIKAAYSAGLIQDGEMWIDMLMDRNRTTHIYNSKMALEIYENIKRRYVSCFEELSEKIRVNIENIKE
ncbi:nucleotidyltransferase substrate binding protein [Caldanaerobacter subterraneus]|uniref:Nucleotidyltransferase n=1 Tax=Caldanaerobacter subterraneus TaxID=911092 RepID=A0A7Y2L5U3_9THEO|nr:nucleotidyltransferase substrate binding protein [Caldanaerobacter subterraneus]NNG66333.1 nucleotidyltransferase [Caldanaerobacter subterraneus]